LLAVLFGIPIKEFGFGNTMILSGVIGVCSGLLILSLWVVAREIRALALRLSSQTQGAGQGAAKLPNRDRIMPPLPAESIAEGRRNEPAIAPPAHAGPMPIAVTDLPPAGSPATGSGRDAAAQDRPEPQPGANPEPDAKPAEPKRRNLLFSSMSRKERERKAAEGAPADATGAGDAAPRISFDDAWPERARADSARRPRPATFADRANEPGPAAGPAAVTVLKSGVVDGMAYSLYSDGSIEAQMPEGMMRFASIDELRAHLEQRP
jgi:hypothetical protein